MKNNNTKVAKTLLSLRKLVFLIGFIFSIGPAAHAIPGLKLQIQGSNAFLSWPSIENQTYILQYRRTLSTNTPWLTLTNNYPATESTNWTTFVHSNIVEYPTNGASGTNEGGFPSPFSMQSATTANANVLLNNGLSATTRKLPPMPPPAPWESANLYVSRNSKISNLNTGVTQNEMEYGAGLPMDYTNNYTGFYRVVAEGVQIIGITNNTSLAGRVNIPVEIGCQLGSLQQVTILIDGQIFYAAPIIDQPFDQPFLSFVLDTTRLSNGVHTISAKAVLDISGQTEPSHYAVDEIDSEEFTINVFNEISFPDWADQFSDTYDRFLITAQSAHSNVMWYMDVYNSSNTYIGSFMGQTTNGQISVIWNLLDYNNVRHSPDYFQVVVSTEWQAQGGGSGSGNPASGSASGTSPKASRYKDNFPEVGTWIVVHQDILTGMANADLLPGIADGFVQAAEAHSYAVYPPHQESQAYRISTNPNNASTNWAAFKAELAQLDTRNLFYFGHASPQRLGGYTTTNLAYGLTPSQLSQILQIPSTGIMTNTNCHSFRFVFIDGCESAAGTWQDAFGIGSTTRKEIDFYNNSGIRPSAFVGWTGKKWIYYSNSIQLYHLNFMAHFLYEWFDSIHELDSAIANAANYSDASGINVASLKTYGYQKLKYFEANFR